MGFSPAVASKAYVSSQITKIISTLNRRQDALGLLVIIVVGKKL